MSSFSPPSSSLFGLLWLLLRLSPKGDMSHNLARISCTQTWRISPPKRGFTPNLGGDMSQYGEDMSQYCLLLLRSPRSADNRPAPIFMGTGQESKQKEKTKGP